MYRTICCELWTDQKVKSLTPSEKLLFVYLITNPHSHMSGIYYLPIPLIQYELNLGRGFDGVWMGLLQSGLVEADATQSQVWVVNMFPYQARGYKADRGVASHLTTLHASPLLERFLQKYPQVIPYLPTDFIRCPIDTPSIPDGDDTSPVPDPDSSLKTSELGVKSNSDAERSYLSESKEVLAFLNEKSGKKYREVGANLDLITARLKSGVTPQECKTLIARKVRDWGQDEKMARYLRPETLFNRTKFEAYLAEVTA